jgi:hypothetical protein
VKVQSEDSLRAATARGAHLRRLWRTWRRQTYLNLQKSTSQRGRYAQNHPSPQAPHWWNPSTEETARRSPAGGGRSETKRACDAQRRSAEVNIDVREKNRTHASMAHSPVGGRPHKPSHTPRWECNHKINKKQSTVKINSRNSFHSAEQTTTIAATHRSQRSPCCPCYPSK